jgi:dienelactone hydrolase
MVAAGACLVTAALAAPAQASIPTSLYTGNCTTKDAADGETTTNTLKPYIFCDDGVPAVGGATANVGGVSAVTVPAKYGTSPATFAGLPDQAGDAATMLGAAPDGTVALDVDVSLPASAPPVGGYPVIFMMHGCCAGNKTSWEGSSVDAGGEKWHYNNAWYASRGYVVVTYTARGFVHEGGAVDQGSTGETQLDSRSFEINDYQSLACQVLANSTNWDAANGGTAFSINPDRVVATGGSYGGGFAWLALTDPKWTCTTANSGVATPTPMSLAAVAPRYGWTDLAYTLVPNGTHTVDPEDPLYSPPDTTGCDTGTVDITGAACPSPQAPIGVPKKSIVGILYTSGTSGTGDGNHTTFPPSITNAFTCLQGSYPLDGPLASPTCASTLSTVLPEYMRERSAYYQNSWFTSMAGDASFRVPIYNAGTLTDPLFPSYENRRMVNRILAEFPTYPIKQYYGDYEHFVQNKAKEWGDICGGDHHVCTFADAPGGDLNVNPTGLMRTGVTTRLNKFIDNYALPLDGYGAVPGNVTPDVTAALQTCPPNASAANPADEPGPTIGPQPTFEDLTASTLDIDMQGAPQSTTSLVQPNEHAVGSDPLFNFAFNGGRCRVETTIAEPGIASYTTSTPLTSQATMVGSTQVTIDFALTGPPDGLQLDARLYDVQPNGNAVLVDRGPRRLTATEAAGGQVAYELHGNGWRFPVGDRVRIEIAQDDDPFVKRTDVPSSTAISRVQLAIPTVESHQSTAGTGDQQPSGTPPGSGTGTATGTGGGSQPTSTKKCKKKKKGKKSAVASKGCKKKKKK